MHVVSKEQALNTAVILKPYFQMLKQNTTNKFKIALLFALKTLLHHLDKQDRLLPTNMTIWNSYMELLQDPNFEVRYAFW